MQQAVLALRLPCLQHTMYSSVYLLIVKTENQRHVWSPIDELLWFELQLHYAHVVSMSVCLLFRLASRAAAQSCLQSNKDDNNTCVTDMKPLRCPVQPQMSQSKSFSIPDQTLKVCFVVPSFDHNHSTSPCFTSYFRFWSPSMLD